MRPTERVCSRQRRYRPTDEEPNIVEEAADSSGPIKCLLYHALGGRGVCEVALDGEKVGLIGEGIRSRSGYDAVVRVPEGGREGGADAP